MSSSPPFNERRQRRSHDHDLEIGRIVGRKRTRRLFGTNAIEVAEVRLSWKFNKSKQIKSSQLFLGYISNKILLVSELEKGGRFNIQTKAKIDEEDSHFAVRSCCRCCLLGQNAAPLALVVHGVCSARLG